VAIGDMLDIDAPYGRIHLPVAGVIVDYSDQQGTIVMDRRVFISGWHDDTVNMFRVYFQPGSMAADVRRAILQRYEGHRQLFVLTNSELKGHVLKVAGQWFQLTLVQIVVAVLVAIFGIANTLTVSITDRRRELAVLQSLGAFRGQIRRTIWIEALGVAAMGLVLGSGLGAINLYYVLQIVQRDIVGLRLDYVFPIATVLMLVPAILAAAFFAAIWPAELALRGSLVEALEYE
jgi:putative ABC transport system permease protein